MEIVPLGPGFAAELRGVTRPDVAAGDAAYTAVRAAFEEHSVLVFRDQDVTDEAQLAFSRRFGPLEVTKVGSEGTGTHLVILKTLDENGKVVPEDHRLACATRRTSSGMPTVRSSGVPALASVLSSRIIPGRGGETEYRLDPARLRAARSGAANAAGKFLRLARLRLFARQDRARPCRPGGARGAAAAMLAYGLENPVNGRGALYIASHAYAIEGMEQNAAQKLLAELMEAATAPGRELPAHVAQGRRGDVGQPRDHASRLAMAGEGAALHGADARFPRTAVDGLEAMHAPPRQAAE